MRFHVAYNQNGRILAAAEEGADQPAAMAGTTVETLEVPAEFEDAEPLEFFHRLRVDVRERKLIRGI